MLVNESNVNQSIANWNRLALGVTPHNTNATKLVFGFYVMCRSQRNVSRRQYEKLIL